MRMGTAALMVVCGVGLSACDQATAPAAAGSSQMEVAVRGDQASPQASQAGARQVSQADGRIEVEARVWVSTGAGGWVELTRGAARESVQASGSDGAKVLASSQVDAATYHRVRVEFDRVQADLGAGVQIGGSLLSGSVQVDGGSDGRVTVEREVTVEARSGSTARLDIDLNADAWLGRADAGARSVGEAEFRDAVLITAR